MKHLLHTILRLGAAAVLLTLSTLCVHATVDDAHSAAISTAVPYIEKGFNLREDYLKGQIKPGAQKLVKQQLFKGNEIWFWLGTQAENVTLEIEVFDKAGKKVSVEKKTSKDTASVRVIPERTATYFIVFKINGKVTDELDWALLYGWRTLDQAKPAKK